MKRTADKFSNVGSGIRKGRWSKCTVDGINEGPPVIPHTTRQVPKGGLYLEAHLLCSRMAPDGGSTGAFYNSNPLT